MAVTNNNQVCASITTGFDLRGPADAVKPTKATMPSLPNGSTYLETTSTHKVWVYDEATDLAGGYPWSEI